MKKPTFGVVPQFTLLALYVSAGWVLLTHVSTNHGVAPTMPIGAVGHGAGVTITIGIFEGGSLSCATSATRASTDMIVVSASEVAQVVRELECWEPDDS